MHVRALLLLDLLLHALPAAARERVDVDNSLETLEAKLLAGKSGYDVVVPQSAGRARTRMWARFKAGR